MSREYKGRVTHVIFSNDSESFYIMKMRLEGIEGLISVKGNVSGMTISEGSYFAFIGSDPKYEARARGDQIEIYRAPIVQEGWTVESAQQALSAAKIGPAIINMISLEAGDKMVDYLNDPELLATVPNLSVEEQARVIDQWRRVVLQFETVDFLQSIGVPARKIDRVRQKFPDEEVVEILTENPWRLVEIDGIDFLTCDAAARKLDLSCTPQNELRMRGATLYAAKTSTGMGHTYMTIPEVVGGVRKLDRHATVKQVGSGIGHLHNDKLLFFDRKTNPEIRATYIPYLHEAEEGSARILTTKLEDAAYTGRRQTDYKRNLLGLTNKEKLPRGKTLRAICEEKIEEHQQISGIDLSDQQCEGVLNALTEPVSVITGLPGTGKSTSLKMLVTILKDAGQEVLLVAPTGIAAKRMAQVTGQKAETIHRAMKARGGRSNDPDAGYAGVTGSSKRDRSTSVSEWGRDETDPHEADIVVVDEASMVDQMTLYMLLRGTRKSARFVFVGDAAQLPSVGPGNVLKDLIRSEVFPSVHLDQIFRQASTSDIVRAAHNIYHGECPNYPGSKEWKFIGASSEEKAKGLIVKIATGLYERRKNFQILSPKHRGDAGVTELNRSLREILNPPASTKAEFRIGKERVRIGDRVMIVRNDYELGVFNGDVGKIEAIGKENDGTRYVQVKIHGPPIQSVRIPTKKAASLIRMAYAITVHKSQGQEFDEIVIPVLESQGRMLQRNLLYTAITRAKKKVYLIGTAAAVARAVRNDTQDHRNTLFDQRLRKLASAENETD